MRFDFFITFNKNLHFKCIRCGRCCSGFGTGIKLELYRSDIDFIYSHTKKVDYYHKEGSLYFMNSNTEKYCPFYHKGTCILKRDLNFFPWNCDVFPLQAVEKDANVFIIRINPAANEICPGIGRGQVPIKDSLLVKLITGIVGIKINNDPRSISTELALLLSNISWL